MNKPIASLSLDFDNKWAYLRAAGRENWESCSSYLPEVADRIVSVLREVELPLTVFVVGRDLQSESDRAAVTSFNRLADVEFANHSLNHLPWMHTMSHDEIFEEIENDASCPRRSDRSSPRWLPWPRILLPRRSATSSGVAPLRVRRIHLSDVACAGSSSRVPDADQTQRGAAREGQKTLRRIRRNASTQSSVQTEG